MSKCLLSFVLSQESSKNIQVEAFHVFKVNNKKYLHTDFERTFFERFLFGFSRKIFVANANKPPDIVTILLANRSKLLRFFSEFKSDKGMDWCCCV